MFYQINEIIDINLHLLFISKEQTLHFSEFKDKNGQKLEEIVEFFQIMEAKKLIKIENNQCILTEYGEKIARNGGWFEHLNKKKETEKIKTEETKKNTISKKTKKNLKSYFIARNSFTSLTNRFKNILKK